MLQEEFSVIEYFIDMFLETFGALRFPHEPELENVSAPTALNVFVASVVRSIVEFVFLEEVLRFTRVAFFEDVLVSN